MTRTASCIATTLLVLVAMGGSAINAQESGGWSLRVNGTYTDPARNHFDNSDSLVRVEANTAEAYGLALSGEYRFSDRLGLEVGIQAGYEADVRVTVSDADGRDLTDAIDPHPEDGLRFTVLDAALNIYLASGGVDFYIGPVIGYIAYDDLRFLQGRDLVPTRVAVDGDFAFGGVLGLDIPCGDNGWFFTSSLKYLVASYEARLRTGGSTQDIDFDPFIVRAGFGYRF